MGSEVSYCRERAFRGLPRLQALSHFVPESIPLPVVAGLNYFSLFSYASFPANVLEHFYSRKCFCKVSLSTGKREKDRQGLWQRQEERSKIQWFIALHVCPHLNSDKVELLFGGSSADPQFACPMGNHMSMAHALENYSPIY